MSVMGRLKNAGETLRRSASSIRPPREDTEHQKWIQDLMLMVVIPSKPAEVSLECGPGERVVVRFGGKKRRTEPDAIMRRLPESINALYQYVKQLAWKECTTAMDLKHPWEENAFILTVNETRIKTTFVCPEESPRVLTMKFAYV